MAACAAFLIVPLQSFGQTTDPFSDVPAQHPFGATIEYLKNNGMVKGYPDGTFAPESSISRAEFITIVVASIDKNPTGENCFKDVQKQWFARFVCSAKNKGLISGYADGNFKPQNNINFAEASAVLARAYNLKPATPANGEPWYKPIVSKLAVSKAIPVTIDYLDKKLSRAESSEMIWRLKTKTKTKPSKTYAALSSELPKISSCAELKEKMEVYQYRRNRGRLYMYKTDMAIAPTGVQAESTAMAEEEGAGDSAGGSDYSSTNIQVEGVDEADVIKNDGEFIYMISTSTVRIIKAVPPTEMTQVAKVELSDKNFTPSEMYVAGNKLVVVGSTYNSGDGEAEESYYGGSRAKVFVLDMTDKSNLKEERSVEFDGYNISSRRIGKLVYLVVNNSPSYRLLGEGDSGQKVVPLYNDSTVGKEEPVCGCSDIRFLPKYNEPNFLVVASINIEDPSAPVQKETVMGSGNTVYSSLESLYVATTQYDAPEAEIFNIWTPPTNGANEKTVFFRFDVKDGNAIYKNQGSVKGHLLNQFSMDESGNYFRVATTIGEVWDSVKPSKNNLFILDRENLNSVVGKVENIAPGEKIYSVRFMGKRAYMVTFKKVDPFFVIDVADPANPKILGALKIPGYSDYLHPYDENHIIGFGKDAVDPKSVEEEWPGRDFDFAWYQGMKIALFDVTDPTNPTMMFKEMIGDRGTDSEVLSNHKALFYDKVRNLFAIPVTVKEIKDKTSADEYTGDKYGTTIFQGAYVYSLDLQNGFQLKGKITNYAADFFAKAGNEYWYEDDLSIKRIVYIKDYLYTVAKAMIKATKLDSMEEAKALPVELDPQQP